MTIAIPSERLRPRAIARDPRLDVFRGLGMAIILIAHIPGNAWTLWIPARFGFSDATEMFVFLSGMASAIAFGGVFDRRGGAMLTARVAHRIWQIWWVHLCLFIAVFALLSLAGDRHVAGLNLQHFAADPGLIVDFLRLSYVPNYFDILPMYIVILALMPVMLLAERLHRALPFVVMVALWGMAQTQVLHLPAEPWSDRGWFFDPFGWQLLFYLGFFWRRGSLPAPVPRGGLLAASVAVVVLTVPFAWFRVLEAAPAFASGAEALAPLTDKTAFGLLRLVHFLALAVICLRLSGPGGAHLSHPALAPATEALRKIGQQSLAVFVASMFLARVIGLALDQTGRSAATTLLANVAGFAAILAIAMLTAWFKSTPWKERRP